jgi:hypothetical protein
VGRLGNEHLEPRLQDFVTIEAALIMTSLLGKLVVIEAALPDEPPTSILWLPVIGAIIVTHDYRRAAVA